MNSTPFQESDYDSLIETNWYRAVKDMVYNVEGIDDDTRLAIVDMIAGGFANFYEGVDTFKIGIALYKYIDPDDSKIDLWLLDVATHLSVNFLKAVYTHAGIPFSSKNIDIFIDQEHRYMDARDLSHDVASELQFCTEFINSIKQSEMA